jgi:Tir chaperone protein (CesT) family
MFASVQAVYDDLAKTLGVAKLPTDDQGSFQLAVGETSAVNVFAEDEFTLLLATAVMELPPTLDHGSALWLLRRNFYASPIAPFRVACDAAGNLVVWGRVPVDGLTGERLAALLEALGTEADLIRGELETDDGTEADAEDEPDATA